MIPEKEKNTFYKKTSLLQDIGRNDTREEIELLLTPPIIITWAYQLAFGISEGCYRFQYKF